MSRNFLTYKVHINPLFSDIEGEDFILCPTYKGNFWNLMVYEMIGLKLSSLVVVTVTFFYFYTV